MITTYNDIDLQIETVQNFTQEAIYSEDGKDYLYTHLLYVVRAIWNPTATAKVTDFVGEIAAKSMNSSGLRKALLTPRKVLKIGVPIDGVGTATEGPREIIVQAPMTAAIVGGNATYYGTDVNHGPTPLFCNIVEIAGERTMIVDFGIEAWFNECDPMRAILSNRWTMTHSIDEDAWTTRVIEGVAVFRADYLLANNQTADQYRSAVCMPVQDRFKRTAQFTQTADGLQLRYVLTDVEQPQSITPNFRRITRIEGYYQDGISQGNISARSLFSSSVTAASAGRSGYARSQAIQDASNAVTYPEGMIDFMLTVYGSRIATRSNLVTALIRAAIGMGFENPANRLSFTKQSCFLKIDMWSRTASIAIKVKLTTTQLISRNAMAMVGFRVGTIAGDATAGFLVNNIKGEGGNQASQDPAKDLTVTTVAATTNPQFDGGTRGLRYDRMKTQKEFATCANITPPTNFTTSGVEQTPNNNGQSTAPNQPPVFPGAPPSSQTSAGFTSGTPIYG